MADVNNWMSDVEKAEVWNDEVQGDANALTYTRRVIAEKPTSIVLYRGTTAQDAQTVRLEMTRIEPYETVGDAARMNRANLLVLGYRDDPDQTNYPDFDVQPGDVFMYLNQKCRIRVVYKLTPGLTEAWGDIIE